MFTKTIKVVSRLSIFLFSMALMGCELPIALLGAAGGGVAGAVGGAVGGATGFAAGGGGGAEFATIHNPEPASMLLMGGGMMAMAYYKKKMKK